MRETARASILSLPGNGNSVRSTMYSRDGAFSEDAPILQNAAPKASGLRHYLSDDGSSEYDEGLLMQPGRKVEGRFWSGSGWDSIMDSQRYVLFEENAASHNLCRLYYSTSAGAVLTKVWQWPMPAIFFLNLCMIQVEFDATDISSSNLWTKNIDDILGWNCQFHHLCFFHVHTWWQDTSLWPLLRAQDRDSLAENRVCLGGLQIFI